MSDAMPTKVWLHDDGWYTERQPPPEDKWRLREYRRADLVDAEIERLRIDRDGWEQQASDRVDDAVEFARERDEARAEIERLRFYVSECTKIQAELAAERQQARLPEELVERIKQHRSGSMCPTWARILLGDILAWHDGKR